jgi:hypothetical protein
VVALPSQVHFSVGVASLQAAGELGLLALGEALDAVAQQPADLVERVILVAAVTDGFFAERGGGPRRRPGCLT